MTKELEELFKRLELEAEAQTGQAVEVVPEHIFKHAFGSDDMEADFALRHKESGRVMFFVYFGPSVEGEVSGSVVKVFENLRASTSTFSSQLALVSVPRIDPAVGELLKSGGIRLIPGRGVSTDLLAATVLSVFREFTAEKLSQALQGLLKNNLDPRIYATPFGHFAQQLYKYKTTTTVSADFAIKNTLSDELFLVKVAGESPVEYLPESVPERLDQLRRINPDMDFGIILVTRNKIPDRTSRALHSLDVKVIPDMSETEAARVIAEHVGDKVKEPGADASDQ